MGRKTKAEQKKVGDKREKQTEEVSADRSYYYDDAHGYEEYDPENETEDDDDDIDD